MEIDWMLTRWAAYRRELEKLLNRESYQPDKGIIAGEDAMILETLSHFDGGSIGRVKRRMFWIGYLWGRLREIEGVTRSCFRCSGEENSNGKDSHQHV